MQTLLYSSVAVYRDGLGISVFLLQHVFFMPITLHLNCFELPFFFFLVFLLFLGLLLRHMEVPRLGVRLEL